MQLIFKIKLIVILLLSLSYNQQVKSQLSPQTMQHYQKLCSDDFAGRGYINNGLNKSKNYIESYLKDSLNLNPLNYINTYNQPFKHSVNTFPKNISLQLISSYNKQLIAGEDFLVHPASNSLKGIFQTFYIDTVIIKNKIDLIKTISNLSSNTILVCNSKISENKEFIQEIQAYYKNNKQNQCVIFLRNKKLTWGVLPYQLKNCFIELDEQKYDLNTTKIKLNCKTKFIKKFTSENLVASNKTILENDSCIIICAHYDHLGKMGQNTTFYGANDNASGVVMLLDLANKFKNINTKYPLVFIAFAGEEIGLLGSNYFVNNLPSNFKFKLVINLDMVATGDNGLTVSNANNNENYYNLIQQINQEKALLPQIVAQNGRANSDHYPFHLKGIPAIFIYAMGNYKNYHDINDKLENLNHSYYPKTFNLLSDFILEINGRD